MHKVIVDGHTWGRGEKNIVNQLNSGYQVVESRLYNSCNGLMCCLGFAGEQVCGIPKETLDGVTMPSHLKREWQTEGLSGPDEQVYPDLATINDVIWKASHLTLKQAHLGDSLSALRTQISQPTGQIYISATTPYKWEKVTDVERCAYLKELGEKAGIEFHFINVEGVEI